MTTRKIKPRSRGGNAETLTIKQRVFVEELMADENFNATKAAKKAGYTSPSAPAKLLGQPTVQAIIGKALQARITRCQLTADAVLEHLATALFLDPLQLFERTPDGSYVVRTLEDVPEKVRRCITKIKQRTRIIGEDTETYLEVDLMSKDSALVNAMKHLMLVSPEQNMNVNVNGVDLKSLLERVENERNVIDGHVIDSLVDQR